MTSQRVLLLAENYFSSKGNPEAYLKFCRRSMMEFFVKIVNGFK